MRADPHWMTSKVKKDENFLLVGVALKMRRIPPQQLPATQFAYELTITIMNPTADGSDFRFTRNLPAFERVVVDAAKARLDRERVRSLRIVNHQIGIAADANGALARIQSEQSRCRCRSGIDQRVIVDSPCQYAERV